MRNLTKQSVLGYAVLLTATTACIKYPTATSHYDITRLRRKSPHNKPCLTGHITQPFERDGRVQYIGIFANNLVTYPDTAGNYYQVFQPGKHTVSFGTVGLALISVRDLYLKPGDSIRINVHLQQETTKL